MLVFEKHQELIRSNYRLVNMSKAFYNITTNIKDFLQQNDDVSVVTMKQLEEADMDKRTIFPLANIIVQDSTFTASVIQFDLQIALMDIVDVSKTNPKDEDDVFLGNDNLQDILNTQLSVANDLYSHLQRGSLESKKFRILGDMVCNPFQDRFANLLAGWVLNLTIIVPNNDHTIC